MNRRLFQFLYSPVPMLTLIDGQVVITAAGAVDSSSGALVASVTHVGTGIYKFNLKPNSNLNAFIGLASHMISPNSGDSGISTIEIDNDAPADLTSLSAPSFTVKTLDDAGSLVDPASGSTLVVMIYGRNSSVAL